MAAAPKRAPPMPSLCNIRFPCAEKMFQHSTHPQNILLAFVSEAPYARLVLVTAHLHRWNCNFGARSGLNHGGALAFSNLGFRAGTYEL